jgi:hypothetical protein
VLRFPIGLSPPVHGGQVSQLALELHYNSIRGSGYEGDGCVR